MRLDLSTGEPVEISGLPMSARAYAIATLLIESKRRFVVLCADAESARVFHGDVLSFLSLLGHQGIARSVARLPGWESSPYDPRHPSMRARVDRAGVLGRLREGNLRTIITDVAAWSQKSPSTESLDARRQIFALGSSFERHKLESSLLSLGYSQSDPVETPGAYAFRGFILDVFPAGAEEPLRVEFFGDDIERIRPFDPKTQRTKEEEAHSFILWPAQEWLQGPDALAAARGRLKDYCDETGVPKKLRDEISLRMETGALDPCDEFLLPLLEPNLVSIKEHTRDWAIAVNDPISLDRAADELRTELASGFSRMKTGGRCVMPPELLYSVFDTAAAHPSLRFCDIALGTAVQKVRAETTESKGDGEPLNPSFWVEAHDNGTFVDFSSLNRTWEQQGYLRALVAPSASQAERVQFLLEQRKTPVYRTTHVEHGRTGALQVIEGRISAGFRLPLDKVVFLTDDELFGKKAPRARQQKDAPTPGEEEVGAFVASLEDLETDDVVVHGVHGLGRYKGLIRLQVDRINQDFLLLEYAGGDKLYLPVYRLDRIQKYVGTGDAVALDKLGSTHFEKAKQRVRQEIQALAAELLKLYAERSSRKGFRYSPPDDAYREFEAQFPHVETTDQLKAIDAVLADMQSDRIMDRLVCGDVGYGKTEVAMRAAYKAVLDGKQVAVLVPTTILCLQHERSFRERMKDTPVRIASVSRFKPAAEVRQALEHLRTGRLDIIIGTHKLLSRETRFNDLGLVIIDEEHRFGVEHKEKLKLLRSTADALTLTATPIPRTLQMSLFGLRDISVINTPPSERLAVRTYVARFDEHLAETAIREELRRGGQVFFVHNRVQTIEAMYQRLVALLPGVRILVAHGQLPERELERRMMDFYERRYDVLLCTTIIESGIDIPQANTMLINRADMFGLAQLYQLRGRVGRSSRRAYCYLLLQEEGAPGDLARKRLEVMQRFADLGSGFKVAAHDLEMRGGGEVLGRSQSGHIAAVGYELYTELLQEAVEEQRGNVHSPRLDPEIKVPTAALIPESYVPDVHQRLSFYKQLSQSQDDRALQSLEEEIQDRYGRPPAEVLDLFWLIRVKHVLIAYCIPGLVVGVERMVLETGPEAKLSVGKMMHLATSQPERYGLTPESKIVLKTPFTSMRQTLADLDALLSLIAEDGPQC